MVTYIFELTKDYSIYLAKVRESANVSDYTFLVKKTGGNVTVPSSDVLEVIQTAQSCAGNIFQYTTKFREMMDGALVESQNRNLGWIDGSGQASEKTPSLIRAYISAKNSGTQEGFTQMVGKYYAPSNICGDYEPAKGEKGDPGENGLTPEFVATARGGEQAEVTVTPKITDDSYTVALDFTLPKGDVPTLRFNKVSGFWEYTIDGGNIWTKVNGSESIQEINIKDLR